MMCRRNKKIHSKQTISHTETRRKISCGEMYTETHKKKDGSFVTDEARDIAEQIELVMTQNEKDESRRSTNDAIGKVFGEEHSGRLANSSTSISSTNYSQADFKRLESKFDEKLTALKTYFLSKEGRISIELTSIFDHGAQVNCFLF
ncbi:hypothetical protein AHAS_Ahas11G0176100 [Arachis hypogaea]